MARPSARACCRRGIRAWKAATRWPAFCSATSNPSGKLPATFPKKLSDSPAHALGGYPGTNGTVTYAEGLLVGYRWFDTKNIEPQFPFGFGLSYTTFKYSNLKLLPGDGTNGMVTAQFEIENTGKVAGAEVAQLYVHEKNPAPDAAGKRTERLPESFPQAGRKTDGFDPAEPERVCLLRPRQKCGWRNRTTSKSGSAVLPATPACTAISTWQENKLHQT